MDAVLRTHRPSPLEEAARTHPADADETKEETITESLKIRPTPTPPSIGRVVHYHSYRTPGGEYLPEPRAAIITATSQSDGPFIAPDMTVSLCVLNPTGMFFNERVEFSEEPKPGHWSWPPRV